MAILSGIPVLNCQSIDATLNFYQQLLQFVVVNKRESGGQLSWVHLMHGSTTLMLQAAEDTVSEMNISQQSKIKLYYFVNNINDLHHFIKAKYRHVSELVLTDYGMYEFSLHDPEGNEISLGQKNN